MQSLHSLPESMERAFVQAIFDIGLRESRCTRARVFACLRVCAFACLCVWHIVVAPPHHPTTLTSHPPTPCSPKVLMNLMTNAPEELELQHLKSHLQKFRLREDRSKVRAHSIAAPPYHPAIMPSHYLSISRPCRYMILPQHPGGVHGGLRLAHVGLVQNFLRVTATPHFLD